MVAPIRDIRVFVFGTISSNARAIDSIQSSNGYVIDGRRNS